MLTTPIHPPDNIIDQAPGCGSTEQREPFILVQPIIENTFQDISSRDKNQDKKNKIRGEKNKIDQKFLEKTPTNRKINKITKTEFFNKIKDKYTGSKDGEYYLKKGHCGLVDGKADKLKWDYTHEDCEAWNKSKHLGSIDPETHQLYKGPKH